MLKWRPLQLRRSLSPPGASDTININTNMHNKPKLTVIIVITLKPPESNLLSSFDEPATGDKGTEVTGPHIQPTEVDRPHPYYPLQWTVS